MDQNTRSISIHLTINKETSLYHFRYRDFYFHEFSPYLGIGVYYGNTFLMDFDGDFSNFWNTVDSYGMIYTTNSKFNFRSPDILESSSYGYDMFCVESNGVTDSIVWGVDHSYGKANSPNVSSYGSSSFYVLDSGETMGGELAPESNGIFYFL